MSEVACTKAQEEYEDDFEKDLDWLISEESRSVDLVSQASVYSAYTVIYLYIFILYLYCIYYVLLYTASLFYCMKRSLECCSTYSRLGAEWVPDPAL